EEELERLLPQLKNAERLKTAAQEAYGLLYGNEGSALDKVRRVQRSLETLRGQGADLNDVAEMMEEAVVRLEESSHRIDDFQNKVDLDPNRLDEVHTRLDLLSRLKHKYGPTLRDVLVYRAKIDEELKVLENVEERTRDLTQKLASAEAELNSASGKLSAARTAAAKKLAAAVEKEFREVGLAQAEFDVSIDTTVPPSFSAVGIDEVRFLFSPNPGEGRQSLAAVASGGELSRVMLAIKSVLAKADAVPTLVFDEIDAGVGGALGTAVGKKLAKLGKTHQVLCITHLASIAAFAQTHFAVQKEIRKERTVTQVKKLQGDDRVAEIARMFGGVADTSTESSVSVRHARELLASAKIQ
ncbi:MAG: DNA repair protein RecN, partial [Elusimicrobia bacterium]|nr:DNA repair protein RecN [Candidatus Obscuribacterium magneticum]